MLSMHVSNPSFFALERSCNHSIAQQWLNDRFTSNVTSSGFIGKPNSIVSPASFRVLSHVTSGFGVFGVKVTSYSLSAASGNAFELVIVATTFMPYNRVQCIERID